MLCWMKWRRSNTEVVKKQDRGRPGRTRKRRFYGKPAKKGPSVPAEQIFENLDATSSDSESDNDGSDSSPDVLSCQGGRKFIRL